MILAKNEAFAALERAELHMMARQRAHLLGRLGPVPEAWQARYTELAAAYELAKQAARATA